MGDAESWTAPATIKDWSFSRLTTYEGCNLRGYLQYALKRAFAETYDRSHAERGNAIHTGAETYLKGEAALIKELTTPLTIIRLNEYKTLVEQGRAIVEQEWGFTRDWQPTGWFAPDTWQRTKCDVVADFGDLVEVGDWKSGKKDGNEVKHAQQAMLYAIDALIKYPKANEVRTRFIYTDESREKVMTHSRIATMRMLPDWDARARKMTQAMVFPHKANKINCRFCPYAPHVNGGDGSCQYGVEAPTPTKRRVRTA